MKRIRNILILTILWISTNAQNWEMPRRFPMQGEKPGLIEVPTPSNPPVFHKSIFYPTTKGTCNCIDTLYLARYTTSFLDVQDFDSAYFVSGYTCNERHLLLDPDNPTMLVRMKVDYSGNVVWQHIDSMMRGDHFTMYNTSMIQTSDSNFVQMGVVVNDYNSFKNYDIRMAVYIKFDTNGDTLWRRMYVDTANLRTGDWPQDIVAEDDGGFTVAALIAADSKTYSTDTLIDYWYTDTTYVGLIRYDNLGNIVQRQKHFVGGEKVPISIGLLLKQPDGGYIVGGENRFNGPTNLGEYYLLKVDNLFNWQWSKTFSQITPYRTYLHILPDTNNQYYFSVCRSDTPIVYDSYGNKYYNGYYHIGRMDSAFNVVKDTIFKMFLTDPINPFYYDAGLVIGLGKDLNSGISVASDVGYGANLIHLNSDFSIKWNRWLSYYPYFAEQPYKMRRAHDGGYLIVGKSFRSGTGGWFVKTDTNGFALPNGADTLYHIGIDDLTPFSDQKLNIYPNPTHNYVTVSIENRQNFSEGILRIFDIAGKKTKEINIAKNQSMVQINIMGFEKGIYLIKLCSETKIWTGKLVVY